MARGLRLLEEIARPAQQGAPKDLAAADPALFTPRRAAVTRHHLAGWTTMTPERVASLAQQGNKALHQS